MKGEGTIRGKHEEGGECNHNRGRWNTATEDLNATRWTRECEGVQD